MLKFDHAELAKKLEKVSMPFRPLFAAMVAERLFPHATEFFGQRDAAVLSQLRIALEKIWKYGFDGVVVHAEHEVALAACVDAIQAACSVAIGGENYPLTGVQRKVAEEMKVRPVRSRDIQNHDAITEAAFFAENAAAAIAYGLEAIVSANSSDLAFAGQRAYDTVDRFVMLQERDLGAEWTETQILAHPIIQRELQRQLNDMTTLEGLNSAIKQDTAKLTKLRETAQHEARSIFLL